MNPSDVFKLSTLATAIIAIMPAIANAEEAASTVIKTPQIIQGSTAQADADKTKTVAITKADDETKPLELTGVDATHGKVEDSEVDVAGIYVGVNNSNTALTATYEGDSINVNVQTKNDATARKPLKNSLLM